MKIQFTVTYKDLYEEAKHEGCTPGSNLGSKVRNTAETVNAAAKAGVALVAIHSVAVAGHVAGFVQGFLHGVSTSPKA